MKSIEQILKASDGLLDFHTHSTHSDGSRTPSELVVDAKNKGVIALALTDHNEISGLSEFNQSCKTYGIFPIPFGSEIFAELPSHLVGQKDNPAPDLIILGKNPNLAPFKEYQELVRKDLIKRFFPETVEKLRNLGYTITQNEYDYELNQLKKKDSKLVSDLLMNFIFNHNNLSNLDKYLSDYNIHDDKGNLVIATRTDETKKLVNRYLYAIDGKAFVKRIEGFNVDDAINLAKDINCKSFVAHPGGDYGALTNRVLKYYAEKNLGIEVRNYFNDRIQNNNFDLIATSYGLTRSGGSDYHGPEHKFQLGMHDKKQNQLDKTILKEIWDALP
ncbi:MAG: PHP domain-containing protein [Candidatus Pacearchaeota archaeon]|jgi:hypothetical protein